MTHWPDKEWRYVEPAAVGLDGERLESLHAWLDETAGERAYRVVVARAGQVAAEWNHGLEANHRRGLASGAKSVYSCLLGIAVAEGRLRSADEPVLPYYPEMMDVPAGRGPKEGRYAFEKDRTLTFRQLISNTSGYLKPGELPGTVFNYQTFGMNVLTHALGTLYGVYQSTAPGDTPGFGQLIDSRIKEVIGGSWTYQYNNFEYQPLAPVGIFGNYCAMNITALDMARLGLLWVRAGAWVDGRQVVPAGWLRSATRTAANVLEHAQPEEWSYGMGFWCNDQGLLWPEASRSSFAASGAGRMHIWCWPEEELVVVQGPGLYEQQSDSVCRRVIAGVTGALVN